MATGIGAGVGSVAGGILGSVFPVIGTAMGGGAGAAIGGGLEEVLTRAFSKNKPMQQQNSNQAMANTDQQGNWFSGSPGHGEQISTLRPDQIELQKLMGSLGRNRLQNYQNSQFNFEPLANKIRTNFRENTVPMLAERFSALGGSGQRSSGFTGTLGQAGAGLEQGIGALEAQYDYQNKRDQMSDLFKLLEGGLAPSFDTLYHRREPGFAESAAGPSIEAILKSLPSIIEWFTKKGATNGAASAQ